MIKGSIQEEDITIVNIYAPNIGTPQYIRQMLTAIKGEIDSNIIILVDLWDNCKCNNIRIIGVPEGEERERKDPRKYLNRL